MLGTDRFLGIPTERLKMEVEGLARNSFGGLIIALRMQ